MSLGEVLIFRVVFVMLAFWLLVEFPARAREVEKISFPEQMDVAGGKLLLNGAGLRIKRVVGLNFHVYVAGLYLEKKNANAGEIIASDTPKVLDMVFLRDIGAGTLRDGWKEGYEKNCKSTCDSTKANLKAFNDLMDRVKEGQHLTVTFKKDGVDVAGRGHVDSADFSKNMLAVFIGDNPPTAEFKTSLLGP